MTRAETDLVHEGTTQSPVRFFLAAAMGPRIQASARWIGVDARSRRAFALSGKDSGSPLLRWIAEGRPPDGQPDIAAAVHRLGMDDRIPGRRFRDWYRVLNRGYPFLDYSRGDALAADADLMAAYATRDDQPPPSTRRSARRVALPPGRLDRGQLAQEPTWDLLAGWLRVAAGIVRLRRSSQGTVAHKTSPSGGARHPTDLAVTVGATWSDGSAGNWWYDPLTHELVETEWTVASAPPLEADDLVFAVTSHVERAMWRYRDVRAFRPLLIDAGHVVETLLTTIESTGWAAKWYPCAGFAGVGGVDTDPVVGYVVASPEPRRHVLAPVRQQPIAAGPGTAFRTNPMMSLIGSNGSLIADNHGNGHRQVVTAHMVEALAYATPSARGDRPTTPGDIAAATGLSDRGLDDLVRVGLLVDIAEGDRLWEQGRPWFAHDWFLSLLMHMEEVATGEVRAVHPGPGPTNLPLALDRRRTCRSLTGGSLPSPVLAELVSAGLAIPPDVGAVMVVRHGGGAWSEGTYVLSSGSWVRTSSATPTDALVTKAAIGQPWARGFSVSFWLVPSPADGPGGWESSLVSCGRAAQRLILAVSADPLVGSFQSPALVDDVLSEVLGEHVSEEGCYLVGFGVASDSAPSEPRLFSPAALFDSAGGSG